jgi:hypothetical protein
MHLPLAFLRRKSAELGVLAASQTIAAEADTASTLREIAMGSSRFNDSRKASIGSGTPFGCSLP